MPGVVRQGDLCTGHPCFPPRRPITWSPDVFVDGRPVIRIFDAWEVHCCPGGGCHGGISIMDRNVTANGRAIQVQGDPINCGSKCDQHSETVSIG